MTTQFDQNASVQALLQTEFIQRRERGMSEARMIRICCWAAIVVAASLLAIYLYQVYCLIHGYVEQHAGEIVTVMVVIQGHRILYKYSGARRIVCFAKRQVKGNK